MDQKQFNSSLIDVLKIGSPHNQSGIDTQRSSKSGNPQGNADERPEQSTMAQFDQVKVDNKASEFENIVMKPQHSNQPPKQFDYSGNTQKTGNAIDNSTVKQFLLMNAQKSLAPESKGQQLYEQLASSITAKLSNGRERALSFPVEYNQASDLETPQLDHFIRKLSKVEQDKTGKNILTERSELDVSQISKKLHTVLNKIPDTPSQQGMYKKGIKRSIIDETLHNMTGSEISDLEMYEPIEKNQVQENRNQRCMEIPSQIFEEKYEQTHTTNYDDSINQDKQETQQWQVISKSNDRQDLAGRLNESKEDLISLVQSIDGQQVEPKQAQRPKKVTNLESEPNVRYSTDTLDSQANDDGYQRVRHETESKGRGIYWFVLILIILLTAVTTICVMQQKKIDKEKQPIQKTNGGKMIKDLKWD